MSNVISLKKQFTVLWLAQTRWGHLVVLSIYHEVLVFTTGISHSTLIIHQPMIKIIEPTVQYFLADLSPKSDLKMIISSRN